jgi:hypothetical protein
VEPGLIDRKAEYLLVRQAGIHTNPVMCGFVNEAWHWQYSGALTIPEAKG